MRLTPSGVSPDCTTGSSVALGKKTHRRSVISQSFPSNSPLVLSAPHVIVEALRTHIVIVRAQPGVLRSRH